MDPCSSRGCGSSDDSDSPFAEAPWTTTVAKQVAMLLIEAAREHDRTGRHELAQRLRQRAIDLLDPHDA